MSEQQGMQLLKQTMQRIKGGNHPGVAAISEYTLEQALDVERKVIEWAKAHNYNLVEDPHQKIENAEHCTRIHVYNFYLKPRIEHLQHVQLIENTIINPPTETKQEQLSI